MSDSYEIHNKDDYVDLLYPEPQPDVAISVLRKQRGSGDLRSYKPS